VTFPPGTTIASVKGRTHSTRRNSPCKANAVANAEAVITSNRLFLIQPSLVKKATFIGSNSSAAE
jgi:hypothetical protein